MTSDLESNFYVNYFRKAYSDINKILFPIPYTRPTTVVLLGPDSGIKPILNNLNFFSLSQNQIPFSPIVMFFINKSKTDEKIFVIKHNEEIITNELANAVINIFSNLRGIIVGVKYSIKELGYNFKKIDALANYAKILAVVSSINNINLENSNSYDNETISSYTSTLANTLIKVDEEKKPVTVINIYDKKTDNFNSVIKTLKTEIVAFLNHSD